MILVIEDERIYQKLIDNALNNNGWHIDIVGDGYSAIDIFNPNIHKLAIIDLVLPGPMNGFDVIKKLLHLKKDLKILVCSGYSNQTITNKIHKLGVEHFISKPFTPNQMLTRVKSILAEINGPTQEAPETVPELFQNFDTNSIHELCKLGKSWDMQNNQSKIVNFTESIILILSGSVNCFYQNELIGELEAGNCLGYESLTREYDPACALTLEATSRTLLCILPKIDFLKYFCSHSDNQLALLKKNAQNALAYNPLYECMQLKSSIPPTP